MTFALEFREKSAVKHSMEKTVLFNFEYLYTMSCPRLKGQYLGVFAEPFEENSLKIIVFFQHPKRDHKNILQWTEFVAKYVS